MTDAVHISDDPSCDHSIVSPLFDDLGSDGKPHSLGIMGGTFDPIHYGHLVCAERVREHFDLDGVVFMPAKSPAFKQGVDIAPPEDRFEMVSLAIADNIGFDVSAMEIERDGITYTIDTLREIRSHYPENVRLFFITGADSISTIMTWHGAEELATLTTFVAATRPGYDLSEIKRRNEDALTHFDIAYVDIPALAISSTELRNDVRCGRSIRYLTTDSVCDYIEQRGLYRA